MTDEQQLRERAEAILAKHILLKHPGLSENEAKKLVENNRPSAAIDAMIDFHKQELQRIGEVVYVPVEIKNGCELPEHNSHVHIITNKNAKTTALYQDFWHTLHWMAEGRFIDGEVKFWLKKLSILEVKDVTDK